MDQANGYICCWDNSGPYLFNLYPACIECHRAPCISCEWVYLPPDSETLANQQALAQTSRSPRSCRSRRSPQQVGMTVFTPTLRALTRSTIYSGRSRLPLSSVIASRQTETPYLTGRRRSDAVYGPVNHDHVVVSCCHCWGSSGVKGFDDYCTNCDHQYGPCCPEEYVKT